MEAAQVFIQREGKDDLHHTVLKGKWEILNVVYVMTSNELWMFHVPITEEESSTFNFAYKGELFG